MNISESINNLIEETESHNDESFYQRHKKKLLTLGGLAGLGYAGYQGYLGPGVQKKLGGLVTNIGNKVAKTGYSLGASANDDTSSIKYKAGRYLFDKGVNITGSGRSKLLDSSAKELVQKTKDKIFDYALSPSGQKLKEKTQEAMKSPSLLNNISLLAQKSKAYKDLLFNNE